MYELLVTYGMLVAIAVAIAAIAIVIILLLNNLEAYFMEIAKGTTAFTVAGKNLQEILPNVDGYKLSSMTDSEGQHWLIPVENEDEQIATLFRNSMFGTVWFQKWLWKTFGVKFISLFWPQTHVHKFDIRKGGRRRIVARNELVADAPLRSRVVDSEEPTKVDSLLFLAPRPVYMEGVELPGDNSKINLLLLPVFRQVIPSLPVFNLKGDFFTLLDAAVETTSVNCFATHLVREKDEKGKWKNVPLTYYHWLKLAKSGGESLLESHLLKINANELYRKELEKLSSKNEPGGLPSKNELVDYLDKITHGNLLTQETTSKKLEKIAPSGIIQRFGFALISFRLVDWEPHKDTEALAKALLAKETQAHTAKGVREEAYGKSDAIEVIAKAESSRYERLVKALVKKGVTPDVAAQVVLTQIRTENIGGKDSKVVTYVEGGERTTSVMI